MKISDVTKSLLRWIVPHGFVNVARKRAKKQIVVAMDKISAEMGNCYRKIDVRIDKFRPKTLNIFVPGLNKKPTAGPQFILEFAAVAMKDGHHVRLLIYGNYTKESGASLSIGEMESKARECLGAYPEPINNIQRDIEICYLLPDMSVSVNPSDMSVATLWNSAYYAQQIQSVCNDKKFIYMIQDDERMFYCANSCYNAVEHTYFMDYYPMFSIDILRDYFLANNIGNIKALAAHAISPVFCANAELPEKEVFMRDRGKKKKLLVYLRPGRNMSELVLYVLLKAERDGLLDSNQWEVVACGWPHKGCRKIRLERGTTVAMLERMTLKEYKSALYKYDVGFVLMRTPHISTPVVDFPLSGLVTVTNACENRTQEKYDKISKNIIAANGTPDGLLKGLVEAMSRAVDLETRYKNAAESKFPRKFAEIWDEEHKIWLEKIMKDTAPVKSIS